MLFVKVFVDIFKSKYPFLLALSLGVTIIMSVASKSVIAQSIETTMDLIHPKINNPQIKIGIAIEQINRL
ncbi:MAG: hypothetical protein WB988_24790 [Candidatus Nitrosopolaris sp.]|jgi:hypothetical protein